MGVDEGRKAITTDGCRHTPYDEVAVRGLGRVGESNCTSAVDAAPSILPAPTLLTPTPIAFANGSRHKIDRAAFGAGPTFGTAGCEGGHCCPFRHDASERVAPPVMACEVVMDFTLEQFPEDYVNVPLRLGRLGSPAEMDRLVQEWVSKRDATKESEE